MKLKTILKRIVGVIVAASVMPVTCGTICAILGSPFGEISSTFKQGFILGLGLFAFIVVVILIMVFISWCFNL